MLHALNDLSTQTHFGTQKTMKAVKHFLSYCASNPDSVTLYHASDVKHFLSYCASNSDSVTLYHASDMILNIVLDFIIFIILQARF